MWNIINKYKKSDISIYSSLILATFLFCFSHYQMIRTAKAKSNPQAKKIETKNQVAKGEITNDPYNEYLFQPQINNLSKISSFTQHILRLNNQNINNIMNYHELPILYKDKSIVFADVNHGWQELHSDWKNYTSPKAANAEKSLNEALYHLNLSSIKNEKKEYESANHKHLRLAYESIYKYLLSNPQGEDYYKSLVILGRISSFLWYDNKEHIANIVFIKVIADNPGEEIAQNAWHLLSDNINFIYSGSAGEDIDTDWKTILNDLNKVAYMHEKPMLFTYNIRR